MPLHVLCSGEEQAVSIPQFREPTLSPLICFSHLRWDFVYQRPQHLMSRFAKTRTVYFIEEPLVKPGSPRFEVTKRDHGINVIVPVLPDHIPLHAAAPILRDLLDHFLREQGVQEFFAWYYTPMMFLWTQHLTPLAVIYDCIDELSLFRGAPPEMVECERELLRHSHVVFTGGASLYEVKRGKHPNVHCFPSSIDWAHFSPARIRQDDPPDQAKIAHPRLGFSGVIDERMDLELLHEIAIRRPNWQLVLIGPTTKIETDTLRRHANIHYLGAKSYAELPAYMAGWDAALLPFALNESMRYISPTNTPEYLAAGRPVISTPIRDVVSFYERNDLVRIAETPQEFCAAVEQVLSQSPWSRIRDMGRADAMLATMSWDLTYQKMSQMVSHVIQHHKTVSTKTASVPFSSHHSLVEQAIDEPPRSN